MKILIAFLVGFSLYVGYQLFPSTYSFMLVNCHGATFDDNHQCKTTEDGFVSDTGENGFLDLANYVRMTVNPLTKNAYYISRAASEKELLSSGFLKDCAFADKNNWQCFDIDTSDDKSYYGRVGGYFFMKTTYLTYLR